MQSIKFLIKIFLKLEFNFLGIAYWMANLNNDGWRFLTCVAIIVLVVQASLAFGTFLSAASPSTNVGKYYLKLCFP